MRIGIFGGAFNPVHNGHIHLIDELSSLPMYPSMEPIDKLLIIPTANPPHRASDDFADGEHRINMLHLAFDSNKKAEISMIEFELDGKSYTFNTIKALKKLYPSDEFFLFIGSDQLLNFTSWYKHRRIAKMAQIVGFSRSKSDNESIRRFLKENEELGLHAVVASPYEMSSTVIREAVRNGESIEGFVPKAVEDYIKEHRLYV